MAHFAQLDNNNTVIQVIVVNDNDCKDSEGNESEAVGAEFCQKLFGGRWIQTSYNHKIRKHFAGIDWKYDEQLDVFVSPKPFDSWALNESTGDWVPPITYPTDGKDYVWDEASKNWAKLEK
jgi:hypothetical protein